MKPKQADELARQLLAVLDAAEYATTVAEHRDRETKGLNFSEITISDDRGGTGTWAIEIEYSTDGWRTSKRVYRRVSNHPYYVERTTEANP